MMDGPKRCGERERWLCREIFRERHRLFQQFTTSHDPVDQAEIEGLPCIELAPAENQLSSRLAADMPWQTLRSAKRRNDADIDFCLGKDGCVRGNHVVSGCTKAIQVRYPDGRPYAATISGQDPNNDLVLLQTDMDNLSIAAFRFWPRIGEQVASYGFPYSGVLSSSGNFTLGHVTSLTGVKDDTRFLQMSAPIQPGNSGGCPS